MSFRLSPDVPQAASPPAVTLKVEGLSVHFGQRTLFKDISFTLLDRELLFVRGPSGIGKSRLFRALAQLDCSFEGDIRLQGKSPEEESLPSWRRKVCYVSDSPPPLVASAEEAFLQVLSFSSRCTVPSNSASQLAYFREVAEQLGVPAAALQRPFTILSAGERQRVSLSWAVALHPLVLLLDEPTSHLDAAATSKFEDLIQQVGSTVVRSLVAVLPADMIDSDCTYRTSKLPKTSFPVTVHLPYNYSDLDIPQRRTNSQSWRTSARAPQWQNRRRTGAALSPSVVAAPSSSVSMESNSVPFIAAAKSPVMPSLAVASSADPVVDISYWKLPLLLNNHEQLLWTMLYITFMMYVASLEAGSRPSLAYVGMHADVGMCLIVPATFALLYMVLVVIDPTPWFNPQYTVPLVGMMLGNSLNGVTVGVKTMLEALSAERAAVEWALTMGATRWEAVGPVFKRVLYTALTPTINMLSVAGLISIPGMMTGQILAGGDAIVAAKYQIMIMFSVAAVGATACTSCITLATLRLTDSHHRLRLDRLQDHNYHAFKWMWYKIHSTFSAIWNRVRALVMPPNTNDSEQNAHLIAGTSGEDSV